MADGALPDDAELQAAGQQSQQQFAAQPPAPGSAKGAFDQPQPAPQWGQSLTQDVGNVQNAVTGGVQGALRGAGEQLTAPITGAAGAVGDIASKVKAYITRQGAMPQQQYQQLRDTIEQSGVTDPNDVTAHAIVQGGPAAVQSTAQHFDALRGNTVKALGDGNNDLAASEANRALQYIPDGTKTMVTATKDGFTASVHAPDGSAQNFDLTRDDLNELFSGKNGFFDHMTGKGVNGVIQEIQRAQTHGGGAFGGPPAGTQQTSPGTATESAPDVPQTPAAQGYNPSFPGNKASSPRPSTGNQAPQNAGSPGVATGEANPAVPGIQQAGGGEGLGDQTGNQGVNVTYGARGTQTVFPGGRGSTRIGNAIFPPGTPPDVLFRARQTLNATAPGNIAPDRQKVVQEMHPGDQPAQAREYANMQGNTDKQASAERIANSRGSYALQLAEARAQQMSQHPQADMAGQGRNAVKVLAEIRAMNPGISPTDLDNELRHRGINPTNILKPFAPEEQGTPTGQQPSKVAQPTQQQALPIPPEGKAGLVAGKTYQTPGRGPLKWDGTQFVPER